MIQLNEFHNSLLHEVHSTVSFSHYDQVEKDIQELDESPSGKVVMLILGLHTQSGQAPRPGIIYRKQT